MEKTISNKMPLYEILTMLVPGALIVYCVWLLDPKFWLNNLADFGYTIDASYLYNLALAVLFFALAYVFGLLNYGVIDGIWRVLRLRNNTCMIKNCLHSKIRSGKYAYVQQLTKQKVPYTIDIFGLSSDDIQDIYYEAYTYAINRAGRSNVPFLEHQVAMLKGLIIPALWLMCVLPPFKERPGISMLVVATILFALALWRQKNIIRLVFEDYEYEKRLDTEVKKNE